MQAHTCMHRYTYSAHTCTQIHTGIMGEHEHTQENTGKRENLGGAQEGVAMGQRNPGQTLETGVLLLTLLPQRSPNLAAVIRL